MTSHDVNRYNNKHETGNQCWYIIGPTSQTVHQHQPKNTKNLNAGHVFISCLYGRRHSNRFYNKNIDRNLSNLLEMDEKCLRVIHNVKKWAHIKQTMSSNF